MTNVVNPNGLPEVSNGGSNWLQKWLEPRTFLALTVVMLVFLGIGLLGRSILEFSNDTEKETIFNQMFTMLLPLFGSWVGTVLAFYFTRENFESATKSYQQLMSKLTPEEKLKSSPAVDNVLRNFHFEVFDKDLTLTKMIANLDDAPPKYGFPQSKKFHRIPVFDEGNRPQYVLHRSMINAFTMQKLREGMTANKVKELTLENLLTDANFKDRVALTFVTLRDTATMADVKVAMDPFDTVQDAFITNTGRSDSAVYGWITNNMIENVSSV